MTETCTCTDPLFCGGDDCLRCRKAAPRDDSEDLCEHGLSAWLCMGPMHYPTAEQEMRGEYY